MIQSGNETSAQQAIRNIQTLQAQYASRNKGRFGNFDELIRTVNLDESFTGERPIVNGYIFTLTVEEPTEDDAPIVRFVNLLISQAIQDLASDIHIEPLVLLDKFNNPVLLLPAMLLICLATLAMNVAANVVAPANDFANLWPAKIDFKRGGLLTALIGVSIMPWKLIADPTGYIITWLVGYSAFESVVPIACPARQLCKRVACGVIEE